MALPTTVDVVIVGAGAAGLGAARAARNRGLTVVVCEAMDRIGGRAFTDPSLFGYPWDRGCHWLHSAEHNPFTSIADGYAMRYLSEPIPWLIQDQGIRGGPEVAAAAATYRHDSSEATLVEGRRGVDRPMSELLDPAHPYYWTFRAAINAEWGKDPSETSTLDAARYRDTGQNWPVADGYGALVARHAANIPVELGTTVRRIAWGGSGVRVTTNHGTIAAQVAIITVSTNVLAAEAITFDPILPPWKVAAAHDLPLGAANKVAFAIDGRHLGVESHTNCLVRFGADQAMSFQLRPFGWDLANGYLSGPLCSELERAGEAALLDAGRQALRTIYGSDIDRQIAASACSMWEREPTILGAYAAARPGRANARADLALPLADRLFFAGEATSLDFFSTCHGAHLSGIAAVDAAAQAVKPV